MKSFYLFFLRINNVFTATSRFSSRMNRGFQAMTLMVVRQEAPLQFFFFGGALFLQTGHGQETVHTSNVATLITFPLKMI